MTTQVRHPIWFFAVRPAGARTFATLYGLESFARASISSVIPIQAYEILRNEQPAVVLCAQCSYRIHLPSGDHVGLMFQMPSVASTLRPVPSALITASRQNRVSAAASYVQLEYASLPPSGDHAGHWLSASPVLNGCFQPFPTIKSLGSKRC